MSDDKDPFAVSRRVVIGAASAAPVAPQSRTRPLPAAPSGWRSTRKSTVWVCAGRTWRQSWCGRGWERMTPEERGELLPSEDMDAIDEQLQPLFDQREAWLEALPAVRARDLHGVVAKLEVALQVMVHQQGDGYDLFKATMEELRTARCPNCGAHVCKR